MCRIFASNGAEHLNMYEFSNIHLQRIYTNNVDYMFIISKILRFSNYNWNVESTPQTKKRLTNFIYCTII